MQIYYMNDEKKEIVVQVNGQLKPSPRNTYGEPTIEYFKLQPTESKVFFVDAPEGSIPYVKKWENVVLLTYLPVDVLDAVQTTVHT